MIITGKDNYYIKGNTVLAPEFEPKENEKKDNEVKRNKAKKLKIKRTKNKLKTIRNISILFIVGITLVARYSIIYDLQKELNNINHNMTLLNKENENLKVDLVKYSNIQYIEEFAKNKLKMVNPTKGDVFYCDMDKEIFKYEDKNKSDNKNKESELKKFLSKLF